MQRGRIMGGILLIVGTTVGAGMLGLPITCGFAGFFPSLILFFLVWSFMLFSSFFFIDVNWGFFDSIFKQIASS